MQKLTFKPYHKRNDNVYIRPLKRHLMVNVRTLRNFIGLAYFGMKHSLRVIINSRKEDIKIALKIQKLIKETYKEMGYHVIEVPSSSVEERKEFIKKFIEHRK